MTEGVWGLLGVITGGIITWFGQMWLLKYRKLKNHQANLIKLQFTLWQITNDIEVFRSYYNPLKNDKNRGISPPIFGTPVNWKLDRETIFNIYFSGTKTEKNLIANCTMLDKKFRGLLGAIEDKMKNYEKYKVDEYKINRQPLPNEISQLMTKQTDAIYDRLEKIDPLDTFKKVKDYMDTLYPDLAIDCTVKNE